MAFPWSACEYLYAKYAGLRIPEGSSDQDHPGTAQSAVPVPQRDLCSPVTHALHQALGAFELEENIGRTDIGIVLVIISLI